MIIMHVADLPSSNLAKILESQKLGGHAHVPGDKRLVAIVALIPQRKQMDPLVH
jgi:hypothetical protein